MKKILLTTVLCLYAIFALEAQYSTLNAHSHNDYENEIPFRMAYDNHFGSIEADIWAINGELFVAHYEADIRPGRTLDSLYIHPVVQIVRQNGGKVWKDDTSKLQLLIDLKTPVEPTLSILIEKLKPYQDVFDPQINPNAVRIVISGNRPEPEEFDNYPEFIFFDGLLDRRYDEKALKRVPLFSENLRKFTSWDGESDIIEEDKTRIQNIIDSVHSLNKKIRFWNAPDNIRAWNTLMNIKVDYINTDHIKQLADFLNNH